MSPTRRAFLASTAAAALTPYLDAASAAGGERPNIVLVIIDTLRADYVGAYGGRAYTPNIDALAARGVRYTRFYPEAMATVPARRSLLTGGRVWPFRGWHRYPTLRNTPGWQPIDDPSTTFTSALRRAGYWTGYVTDNPYLGYSPFYQPFRDSFNHFWRIGGILGRTAPVHAITPAQLHHWLIPELRVPSAIGRQRRYLAAGGYAHDQSRSARTPLSRTSHGRPRASTRSSTERKAIGDPSPPPRSTCAPTTG